MYIAIFGLFSYKLLMLLHVYCTGTLKVYEMIDVDNNRQDEINFITLNIRNQGSMFMNNGEVPHILRGSFIRVYPGGLLETKNLQVEAESVIVDVLGILRADGQGHCMGGEWPHIIYMQQSILNTF